MKVQVGMIFDFSRSCWHRFRPGFAPKSLIKLIIFIRPSAGEYGRASGSAVRTCTSIKRAPDFLLRSLPARADTSHPIAGLKVDASKVARPARAVQTVQPKEKRCCNAVFLMMSRPVRQVCRSPKAGWLARHRGNLAAHGHSVRRCGSWKPCPPHPRNTARGSAPMCRAVLSPEPSRQGGAVRRGAICHVFNSPPSGAGDTGTNGQSVHCD